MSCESGVGSVDSPLVESAIFDQIGGSYFPRHNITFIMSFCSVHSKEAVQEYEAQD